VNTQFWSENLKRREYLEDLDVEVKNTVAVGGCGLDSPDSG